MAEIIPALNAESEGEFQRQAAIARTLSTPWVQVDISDGILGVPKNFSDPEYIVRALRGFSIDLHLMVQDVPPRVEAWRSFRPARITVHLEAIADPRSLFGRMSKDHIECGLALGPATAAEKASPYVPLVDLLLFVSVPPGRSGQQLDPGTPERIRGTHGAYPRANIGVDGGIKAEHVPVLVAAGASTLFVASEIFRSSDPRAAFEQLRHLTAEQRGAVVP